MNLFVKKQKQQMKELIYIQIKEMFNINNQQHGKINN